MHARGTSVSAYRTCSVGRRDVTGSSAPPFAAWRALSVYIRRGGFRSVSLVLGDLPSITLVRVVNIPWGRLHCCAMDSPSLRSTLRSLIGPAYIPTFLIAFSWAAVTPVLPMYLGGLGAGVVMIGVVAGMKSVGQLVSDIPGGLLLSRWTGRRVVVICYLVGVASNGVLVVARSIPWIAAMIFLSGFVSSIITTSIMATVRTHVASAQRGRSLSLVGGSLRMGMLAGPVVGGYLALHGSVPMVFAVRVLCYMLGLTSYLVSGWRSRWNEGGKSVRVDVSRRGMGDGIVARLRQGLRGRGYAVVTVGFAILTLSVLRSAREIILPLWGESLFLHPARIGITMSVGAACDFLFFVPAGAISDRLGRKVAVSTCLLGFSVGLVVLSCSSGTPSYVIAAVIMGVGNGLGAGINMTTGTDLAPSIAVAEFLGVWRLYGDIGSAAAPMIVGGLTAALSLTPAVVVVAGVGAAGAAVMLFLAPETRDLSLFARNGEGAGREG